MSFSASHSTIASRFRRIWPALRRTPSHFVGIDIGVQEITIASLGPSAGNCQSHDVGESLKWKSVSRLHLPLNPLEPASPEWIEQTIQTLLECLPRTTEGERNLVSISLPSTWIHYQVVQERALASCQAQCDHIFQNSIFKSAAYQTHWPVVGMHRGTPSLDEHFVVASTSNDAATRVASAVDSLGYEVQNILPHGAALLHASADLTSVDASCVVLLNRHGGMIAVNHHSGSASPTQGLTAGCGLCRSLPGLATVLLKQEKDHELTLDEIRPWLSAMADEINATLNYSRRANACRESDAPILVCGDMASIDQLDVALANLTNRPVARWQYIGQSRPFEPPQRIASGQTVVGTFDSQYAVALSLAHQSAISHSAGSMRNGISTRSGMIAS